MSNLEMEHGLKRALGVKCSKDTLDWAVVEGDDRASAVLIGSGTATAPAGSRGDQLVWLRKEVQELLHRQGVDGVALRAVEPGGKGNSLPRAEAEGVVLEAVAAAGFACRRLVGASLRSAFAVKNGAELEQALTAFSVVAATPKTRRDPVSAAIAMIGT
jgi:Holliday junction resolvasome RuvABC endonuclease subunit